MFTPPFFFQILPGWQQRMGITINNKIFSYIWILNIPEYTQVGIIMWDEHDCGHFIYNFNFL